MNLEQGDGQLLPDAVSGVTRVVSDDLEEAGVSAGEATEPASEIAAPPEPEASA